MTDAEKPNEGQVILYQTPEGAVRVEVLYESETFWLGQKKMAELFGVDLRTISYHLAEIYASGRTQPRGNSPKNSESSAGGPPRRQPGNRVLQLGRNYFGRLPGQ